jgi:hypothetical protein
MCNGYGECCAGLRGGCVDDSDDHGIHVEERQREDG